MATIEYYSPGLQSTSVAFEEVNEHNVYLTTGQPLPTDIAKIVEWMLNENFSAAYQSKTTPHLPAPSHNLMGKKNLCTWT